MSSRVAMSKQNKFVLIWFKKAKFTQKLAKISNDSYNIVNFAQIVFKLELKMAKNV